MGYMVVGAVLILIGFVAGAFVFRNNPVTGEKIAKIVEDKMNEVASKLKR
jgi:hypothetical protein